MSSSSFAPSPSSASPSASSAVAASIFRKKELRVILGPVAGKQPRFVGADPEQFRYPAPITAALALPKVAGKQPAKQPRKAPRKGATTSLVATGTRNDLFYWAEACGLCDDALAEFGRDWSAFVASEAEPLVGLPLSPADMKRLAALKAAQPPAPPGCKGRGAVASFSPCTTKGGVVLLRPKYDAAVLCEVLSAAVELRYPIDWFPALFTAQKDFPLPTPGTPATWNAFWQRCTSLCAIDQQQPPHYPTNITDIKQLPLLICPTHFFVPVTRSQMLCLLAAGVPPSSCSDYYAHGSTLFGYVVFCAPLAKCTDGSSRRLWSPSAALTLYSKWCSFIAHEAQSAFLRCMLVAIRAYTPTNGNERLVVGAFDMLAPLPPTPAAVATKRVEASQALAELSLLSEDWKQSLGTLAEGGLFDNDAFDHCDGGGSADADCCCDDEGLATLGTLIMDMNAE